MTRKRHHLLIRVLHWLVAFLIIAALIMSALVMPTIPADSPELVDSLRRHMSAGLLVFVLTLLRFVMRRKAKKPPVLSSGMPWADWLARATHRVFDVLILTMIASGVGMALAGGLFPVVFEGVGRLPADLDALPLHAIHRYAAIALFALLALHVAGALFHQFILRDHLLSRMGFGVFRARAGSKDAVTEGGRAGG
ncbi:MAG: cytochrome b/b6 domain-containing protein [Propionivibrio sp.]